MPVADSLSAVGKYSDAALCYRYALFQGVNDSLRNILLLKESICYKKLHNYESAVSTLQEADLYRKKDTVQFQLFYELILNSILCGKYDIALSRCLEWEYLSQKQHQSILFLKIVSTNALSNYDEAAEYYHQFMKDSTNSLYQKVKKMKFKNPEKAEKLSYIFPGLGQFYSAYPTRGLVSLALCSGALGLTVTSLLHGFYFSGPVTGSTLLYLSYFGGAHYARVLAEQRNKELTRAFNNEVFEQLVENKKGQ